MIYLIYVVLLTILIPSIWNKPLVDDDRVSTENPIFTKNILKNIQLCLAHFWGMVRFRRSYPFWLSRVISIVVHLINVFLVYNLWGNLTAFLWGLSPIVLHSALWTNGRRYMISTMLFLLAFTFGAFAPLFMAFIPYWQCCAILSPILFVMTKYWFWIFLIPIGFLMPDMATQRRGIKKLRFFGWFLKRQEQVIPGECLKIHWRKHILYFKTLGYYLRLIVFPNKVSMYYKHLQDFGMNEARDEIHYKRDWSYYTGIAFFMLSIITIILTWGSQVALGLFGFLLFISQWCNIITIQQNIALRYLYLSSLLFIVAVSKGLSYCNPLFLSFLLGGVFAFYMLNLALHQYKNYEALVDHSLIVERGNLLASCIKVYAMIKNKIEPIMAYYTASECYREFRPSFKAIQLMVAASSNIYKYNETIDFIKEAEKNLIKGDEKVCQDWVNKNMSVALAQKEKMDNHYGKKIS